MNDSTIVAGAMPAGFARLDILDDFVGLIGPLWRKPESDGLRVGLMLEPRHGNPMGIAHGGLMVTLADMVMGAGCGFHTGIAWPHPTITLNSDFVRGARIGHWIEGKARLTRRTQSFCFCSADLVSEGHVVLAASGVFKMPDIERIPEPMRAKALAGFKRP